MKIKELETMLQRMEKEHKEILKVLDRIQNRLYILEKTISDKGGEVTEQEYKDYTTLEKIAGKIKTQYQKIILSVGTIESKYATLQRNN